MPDLYIVEGEVEATDDIDIREVLEQTLDLVQQSADENSGPVSFTEHDAYLEKIGIRIGDSESLDPDVYLENPLLAGLWILGQFREIAQDIEDQDLLSYMALLTAWEEFAEHILEME